MCGCVAVWYGRSAWLYSEWGGDSCHCQFEAAAMIGSRRRRTGTAALICIQKALRLLSVVFVAGALAQQSQLIGAVGDKVRLERSERRWLPSRNCEEHILH